MNQETLVNFIIDYAESNHIPLVILTSAFGCSKCANFKAARWNDPAFQAWVANSSYIFLYGWSGSGWWTTNTLRRIMTKFSGSSNKTYGGIPSMGGEWIKEDGSKVWIQPFMVYTSYAMSAAEIANKIDTAFADYKK